jgi:hypothetical protein
MKQFAGHFPQRGAVRLLILVRRTLPMPIIGTGARLRQDPALVQTPLVSQWTAAQPLSPP